MPMPMPALRDNLSATKALFVVLTLISGGFFPEEAWGQGNVDLNSDGLISHAEYKQYYQIQFSRMDHNRDGTLTAREFARLYSSIGNYVSPDGFRVLIERLDKNNEEDVQIDEYLQEAMRRFRGSDDNQDDRISGAEAYGL